MSAERLIVRALLASLVACVAAGLAFGPAENRAHWAGAAVLVALILLAHRRDSR